MPRLKKPLKSQTGDCYSRQRQLYNFFLHSRFLNRLIIFIIASALDAFLILSIHEKDILPLNGAFFNVDYKRMNASPYFNEKEIYSK